MEQVLGQLGCHRTQRAIGDSHSQFRQLVTGWFPQIAARQDLIVHHVLVQVSAEAFEGNVTVEFRHQHTVYANDHVHCIGCHCRVNKTVEGAQ